MWTHQSDPSMQGGSLRSSPSGSLTGSGALAGSWQRNQPVVTCSTHRSTNISKPNMITASVDFIWEIQMANVTGMCSKIPSPNDYTLEVISLNTISLLNGCLQWSKMTRLRMLWLFYILEWMRLTVVLHQVCSVSFIASQMFVYTFATGAVACEIEMEFGFPRKSPFEMRLSVIYWLFDTKQNPLSHLVSNIFKKSLLLKSQQYLKYIFNSTNWRNTVSLDSVSHKEYLKFLHFLHSFLLLLQSHCLIF